MKSFPYRANIFSIIALCFPSVTGIQAGSNTSEDSKVKVPSTKENNRFVSIFVDTLVIQSASLVNILNSRVISQSVKIMREKCMNMYRRDSSLRTKTLPYLHHTLLRGIHCVESIQTNISAAHPRPTTMDHKIFGALYICK